MKENLPEVKVTRSEGTYLLWVDFRAWGMSGKELEDFMTKDALVFGVEGYAFGQTGEGFERLHIGVPAKVLDGVMERLLKARSRYLNREGEEK